MNVKEFFEREDIIEGYKSWNPKAPNYVNFNIIQSLKPNKSVLSLGCGGGREVKSLVEKGMNVTAIDISKGMIDKSKEIEPKANYFCEDAVIFARRNKGKLKFDYIIGLWSFLNLIKKEDRRELIENLYKMLKKDGTMIFEVRKFDEIFKVLIKVLVAPLFALFFGEIKDYEFGDVWGRDIGSWTRWIKTHSYTNSQLKKLFNKFDVLINNSQIYIRRKK